MEFGKTWCDIILVLWLWIWKLFNLAFCGTLNPFNHPYSKDPKRFTGQRNQVSYIIMKFSGTIAKISKGNIQESLWISQCAESNLLDLIQNSNAIDRSADDRWVYDDVKFLSRSVSISIPQFPTWTQANEHMHMKTQESLRFDSQ